MQTAPTDNLAAAGKSAHRPEANRAVVALPRRHASWPGSTTESNLVMVANRFSAATKDCLYVVAIRIEHKGRIVARRVTLGDVAQPWWAVIGPACFYRGGVKGIDLGAVPGGERRMLLYAVRVKAINPENREIDAIADAIGPVIGGQLHDPAEAECTQSGIVKCGGTDDVRDANAGMIDHGGILYIGTGAGCSSLTIICQAAIGSGQHRRQPYEFTRVGGQARQQPLHFIAAMRDYFDPDLIRGKVARQQYLNTRR